MATFYCSEPECKRRWKNFQSKAKSAKCRSCKAPATLLTKIKRGAPYVMPDFPEHFNHSMGCVVKSRAHHKQIQRERGLQDWVPTNNSPGSQLSMGRRH
jgi:hypothetical protein